MVSSESLLLLQGTIVFMHIGGSLSTSSCGDQYILQSSGNCISCRECRAGFEPKIPCGSVIGVDDKIGECQVCPSGTYSSKKDTKSCRKCQSEACFEHQVTEGMCTSTNDASKCTNKCEDGYQMNVHGTKCEMFKPTATRIPTQESPTTKTIIKNTTRKLVVLHSQNEKETGLHVGFIVLIAFIAAGVIFVVIYKFVWPQLKVMGTNEPIDDEESKGGSDPYEEPMKVGQQEESMQTDSPEQRGPHLTETTRGFADNMFPQNSAALNIVPERNEGFMHGTPPSKNDSLDFEVQGTIAPGLQSTRTMNAPNNFNISQAELTRIGDLPLDMYNEICAEFNAGPPGKNGEALAGWFGFNVDQVKFFKNSPNMTDDIIRSWASEADNDIEKFINILTQNRMTALADKIEKKRVHVHLV